jgi:hypothetical protein
LRGFQDAFITTAKVASSQELAGLGFEALNIELTVAVRAFLYQGRRRRTVRYESWVIYNLGCNYRPKRRENDGFEGCLQMDLQREAWAPKKKNSASSPPE